MAVKYFSGTINFSDGNYPSHFEDIPILVNPTEEERDMFASETDIYKGDAADTEAIMNVAKRNILLKYVLAGCLPSEWENCTLE